MDYLYLIGSVQTFFFALVILQSKKRNLSDNILVIWLLIYAINLLIPFFAYEPKYALSNVLIGIDIPLISLHPALLYLYILSFSIKKDKWKMALNLLPFVFAIILMIPFFSFSYEKKLYLINHLEDIPIPVFLAILIGLISNCIYLPLVYKKLSAYDRNLKWMVSYEKKIELRWIWFVFWANSIMFILSIFVGAILARLSFTIHKIDIYLYGVLAIYLFVFALMGIKYSKLYYAQLNQANELKFENRTNTPVNNNQEKKDDLKRLQKIMLEQKPYLNPKLSIFELAEITEISTNHLSKLINQSLNCNFFDFVNTYRVEEVKKQMTINVNYSLVSIANDSGFNSKASFNRIFKKQTGLTPSEYQKKNMSQLTNP